MGTLVVSMWRFFVWAGKGAGADNKFGKTIPWQADDWDNAGYNRLDMSPP